MTVAPGAVTEAAFQYRAASAGILGIYGCRPRSVTF
jgi:hypothetical protein